MLIKAKQLNVLSGSIKTKAEAFTVPNGAAEVVVSVLMASETPGGSDTQAGIVTSGANNKVRLVDSTTGEALYDANGVLIYGRLTHDGTDWKVSFNKSDGAGGEVAHTFSTEEFVGRKADMSYVEVSQLKDRKPTDIANSLGLIDQIDYVPASKTQQELLLSPASAGAISIAMGASIAQDDITDVVVNGVSLRNEFISDGTNLIYQGLDFELDQDDLIVIHYMA